MMRKLLWGIPLSLLLLLGLSAGLVAWNLHTFNRLTDEAPIARLRFVELGPEHYRVELRSGDFCEPQLYTLYGDEWRVDARFLKWKPWANLFGMDALYRLERLSGRYNDLGAENTRRHQAYDIGERPGVDLAEYLKRDWKLWSPVDTAFGSSVYETIDPGFVYTVYRSQAGLLVRKETAAPARYEDGGLVIHISKDCKPGAGDN
jgi:hypothetical protein